MTQTLHLNIHDTKAEEDYGEEMEDHKQEKNVGARPEDGVWLCGKQNSAHV